MPCTPEDSFHLGHKEGKGSVGQGRLPAPASQNNRFGSKEIACQELSGIKVGACVLSTQPQTLRDHLV